MLVPHPVFGCISGFLVLLVLTLILLSIQVEDWAHKYRNEKALESSALKRIPQPVPSNPYKALTGTAGGDRRERVLKRVCVSMIEARRLRTDRQRALEPGTSDALQQLLIGQVLTEWQPTPDAPPQRQQLAQTGTIAKVIFADGSDDMPPGSGVRDRTDEIQERRARRVAPSSIERVDHQDSGLPASPVLQDFDQLMFQADLVSKPAKAGRPDLIDCDKNNVATFVQPRLDEIVEYARFPRSWPSNDHERIRVAC